MMINSKLRCTVVPPDAGRIQSIDGEEKDVAAVTTFAGTDGKGGISFSPELQQAITEALNNGRDIEIRSGKDGVRLYEIRKKRIV
jgi:hypothetical protein